MILNSKTLSGRLPLFGLLVLLASCGPSAKQSGEGTGENRQAEQPAENEDGFVQLFDGKTLDGWEGDTSLWRAENGCLVGEIRPGTSLKANSFIIWQGGTPGDFELKASFRISEKGNSGINYRSEKLPDIPYALKGYQADIDGAARYTGQNYEERKRTTLAYRGQQVTIPVTNGDMKPEKNAWPAAEVTGSLGDTDSLKAHIRTGDWNEIRLVVKGNRLQHYINGVLMSDVTDNDTMNAKLSGFLGMQVHVGPPMKVEYKDIRLKEL